MKNTIKLPFGQRIVYGYLWDGPRDGGLIFYVYYYFRTGTFDSASVILCFSANGDTDIELLAPFPCGRHQSNHRLIGWLMQLRERTMAEILLLPLKRNFNYYHNNPVRPTKGRLPSSIHLSPKSP